MEVVLLAAKAMRTRMSLSVRSAEKAVSVMDPKIKIETRNAKAYRLIEVIVPSLKNFSRQGAEALLKQT